MGFRNWFRGFITGILVCMEEPVPQAPKNKGGRPRKYQTPGEKKELYKRARIARRQALIDAHPIPPAPDTPITPASSAADLQAAIAGAVINLSVPDAVFVNAVCSGKTLKEAFREAHPTASDASAGTRGSSLAGRGDIAAALAKVKHALAANVAYDFAAFMREMDMAINFAQRTNNATAMVRAVELKGKATGSLSDKPAGVGTGFTLVIAGVDSPAVLERAE